MTLDPRKTAFLFPGQGSQFVGMGRSLAQQDAEAAGVFSLADRLLGFPLSTLCWEGPEERLNDTVNTQPALLVHSVAVLRAVQQRLPQFEPALAAGHSMGEFTALVAAGALDFEDALKLVLERGRAMQMAGQSSPGGMAAVLGLDLPTVDAVCREASAEAGGVVQVANDNCPGQVVISGDSQALDLALTRLTAAGAKRAVRLAVSIAAHSPLMIPAQERLNLALGRARLVDPRVPIIGNVHASRLTRAAEVLRDLEDQLTSRVRWTESIQAMIAAGITTFIELGPGSVLSGLVRRIDRSATTLALDTPESLDSLAA